MTDLPERMVEAGARAAYERDATRNWTWDQLGNLARGSMGFQLQRMFRDEARACLTAALALAEREGVMLVPTNPTADMVAAAWRFANRDLEDGKEGQMQNLLCAATLAGKVTL